MRWLLNVRRVYARRISAHDDDQASIRADRSFLTGRSDLSAERNRVDSIMMSNEFDTPFHYEDVAICWAFSLDSRSFSPSPPSILLTLALSVSFRRPVGPPRCSADSLVPTIAARDLCLSPSFSFPRAALFLARSPGPEVVMSDSVVRLVASCRIAANDDVTLETSRLVIQVVSCSVA